jgi:hypothetical protein
MALTLIKASDLSCAIAPRFFKPTEGADYWRGELAKIKKPS